MLDQPVGAQATILVMEDDADTQEMLGALLRVDGYEPVIVGSGEAGLTYLEQEPVDLIILDLRLPGMQGDEVCLLIQERLHHSVPVLMLTANREQHGVVEGLQRGADDYMSKPFAPEELLARLAALLRRRNTLRAQMSENEALRKMLELVQQEAEMARSTSGTEALLRRQFLHNVLIHLQSLCGVIEAEFRRMPPSTGRESVQRILSRVRAATLVYEISETLQNDPVRVDILVKTIATAVKTIYSPRRRIPLVMHGEPVELPVRYASPLAMIMNEVMTNAFKHAFPNQRFGQVTINYGLLDGAFSLEVIDDGVGFATDGQQHGRGRASVLELINHLQGTAEWQSSGTGTTVRVQFPVSQPIAVGQ